MVAPKSIVYTTSTMKVLPDKPASLTLSKEDADENAA